MKQWFVKAMIFALAAMATVSADKKLGKHSFAQTVYVSEPRVKTVTYTDAEWKEQTQKWKKESKRQWAEEKAAIDRMTVEDLFFLVREGKKKAGFFLSLIRARPSFVREAVLNGVPLIHEITDITMLRAFLGDSYYAKYRRALRNKQAKEARGYNASTQHQQERFEIRDAEGKSVLHKAAARNSALHLRTLFTLAREYGFKVDVNVRDSLERTPLHYVRNSGVAELLIQANHINMNPQDSKGMTPLHYAILRKANNVAITLIGGRLAYDVELSHLEKKNIERFYNADGDGYAMQQKVDKLERLIYQARKNGWTREAEKYEGERASVMETLKFRHNNLFRSLQASTEAVVGGGTKFAGCYPIHLAIMAQNYEMLSYLCSGITKTRYGIDLDGPGVDVNVRNAHGYTPIALTVRLVDMKSFRILIEQPVDVSIPNERGLTPVAIASKMLKKASGGKEHALQFMLTKLATDE